MCVYLPDLSSFLAIELMTAEFRINLYIFTGKHDTNMFWDFFLSSILLCLNQQTTPLFIFDSFHPIRGNSAAFGGS